MNLQPHEGDGLGRGAVAAGEPLGGGLRRLLRVGGRLPAASLGLCRDFLQPGVSGLDRLTMTALRMARESAGVMGELVPGQGQTEWLELENKIQAFEGFAAAGARLGLSPGVRVPLAQQVRRVLALGDSYTSLWAMEGLGHLYAQEDRTRPPRELLAPDRLAGLPAAAVLPLHTGSALAFAEGLLRDLERAAAPDRDLVRRWLERCQDDFNPGYRALATEALGLAARNLHPCRLGRLDELLSAVDPVLTEYLWHGVGRGLYFVPTHLPPWSGACRRAFAKAASEPPSEPGRRNAIAGLAWALTLVNVRSPQIVEAALAGCGESPAAGQAIANGVSSALLVWHHWAGWEPRLARFLAHLPWQAERARRWGRQVVDPCRAVLASSPYDLRRRDHLAALFRFQVP